MLRDRVRIVNFLFLCFMLLNFLFSHNCSAISNITSSNPLLQGQTLSSPDQVFELGFFSPNNSTNQYVGIWYKNIFPRTVVWVANREKPVVISLASLQISDDGNLRLVDGKQNVIWSISTGISNDSVAVLLNNGSFIMKDRASGENLWDNFNHPSDTMIPGTRLLLDFKTGERVVTTSWKSEKDPSPGSFIFGFKLESPPQLFIWKGSTPYWRSGLWSKSMFIGVPDMDTTYRSSVFVEEDVNQRTVSLSFSTFHSCSFTDLVLLPTGSLKNMCWQKGKNWYSTWQAPSNGCEIYGACGPFGFCERSQPLLTCRCLKGFVPKSQQEWSRGNWTGGCVRRVKLFCERNTGTTQAQAQRGKEDAFWKISGMKLPDFSENVKAYSDIECSQSCLNNCSCLAYAYVNGIGCLVWTRDLIDVLEFSSGGQDLYLRLAIEEFDHKGEGQKQLKFIIPLTASITIFIVCVIAYGLKKRRANKKLNKTDSSKAALKQSKWRNHLEEQDSLELPMFDLDSILAATDNFDATNKLGQGGFGPVYKGNLQDGNNVAIKRLLSSSGQGMEEFKNEIMLISKLQHRNLVKLIGCCIEREERILIYEFMPNKSLDTYLFDSTKNAQLDWPNRFNIILGVARGILYLHHDSCLRIIHRDLKVSNILLDEKMNPKISDFGLARIFQGTHDLANTRRVVGTLGYMSPEYALGGIFSEKSDVFSFGVLLLEIVSGKRIGSYHYEDQHLGLIAYAWQSWCENSGVDLIDEALTDSFSSSEVIRCVNIGLLCVQDHASDRPTMPAIVSMLRGEAKLPHPKQPTFTFQRMLNCHVQSQNDSVWSINKVTESIVEGR